MKDIIKRMDKVFESRIRIGIMALLMVNDWLDFAEIKDTLGVTDGNLASHAAALERKNMLEVRKQFVGKRPNTSYRATTKGKDAFLRFNAAYKELMAEVYSG